jgi:hypothetical protein
VTLSYNFSALSSSKRVGRRAKRRKVKAQAGLGCLWLVKGAINSMEKRHGAKPGTDLGELIAAAGQVAFEFSNNDKEAYNLAQLALIEILRKTSHALDLDKDFETLSSAGQVIH